MSAIFVTGIGTGVGKTLTACEMIGAARAAGQNADAFKPVLSGFDPARPEHSDAGRLLTALGRPIIAHSLDTLAPLRFAAQLSPPDAALREGANLTLATIISLCNARIAHAPGLLLIEGAGGVMSPIAQDGLNIDLIKALGVPVVLAAANYLGAISHTLTSLEALQSRGLTVMSVVLRDLGNDGPAIVDTASAIGRFATGATVLIR